MSFGDYKKTSTAFDLSSVSGARGSSSYAKSSETIKSLIFTLSSNVASIQRMVSQYGTSKDTQEMRDKLARIEVQTGDLVKEITVKMKEIGSFPSESDEENKTRKLEQQKLSRDFQIVLGRFQQVQRLSAEKSREFVARAKAQTVNLDEDADQDAPLLNEESQRQQELIRLDNEIEYNENIIAEREQSIVQIEQAIHEVNEIFRDLGSLVNEQQGMIDNIEANIESSAARTGDANLELQSASRYQKSARSKMCWLLSILFIVLVVVVIIAVIPR